MRRRRTVLGRSTIADAAAQRVASRLCRKRYLVADDEPGVRESLAEILRDAGYSVAMATDGSAALAMLEEQDFSVVVTDMRMPGADGLAVLSRARELSLQTVVLVMTAHGTIDTAVEALRAGAADYLLKPVVFDDLLAKVPTSRRAPPC